MQKGGKKVPAAIKKFVGEKQSMDLVIMNPPFSNAQSRGEGFSEAERAVLRQNEKDIQALLEAEDRAFSGVMDANAIQTFFTPLAGHLCKPETSTLAMIAPLTICTGAMSIGQRRWIAKNWHVERIVSNHDPKRFNFSENTKIYETMLICRRHGEGETPSTEHLSLRRRPETEEDAHACIEAILSGEDEDRQDWFTRALIPAERITSGDWRFVQWHQPGLEEIVQMLEHHTELVPLQSIAKMGPTGQGYRGKWENCDDPSQATARSFRSVSEGLRQTIRGQPEQAVWPRKGKSLEWTRRNGKASRLLVATGGRTDSGRLMAVYANAPAFGSGWQPVLARDEATEPAIAGWLNSTPGRLLYLNRRAKTLTYPHYSLADIETIPLPSPADAIGNAVMDCWDTPLEQGRHSANCAARAILDEAAAQTLGIPVDEVSRWRTLLAQEPTVSGQAIETGNDQE